MVDVDIINVKLRKLISDYSINERSEVINEFKKILNKQDGENAVEFLEEKLESTDDDETKFGLLHLAVKSKRQDLITRIIKPAQTDETDSPPEFAVTTNIAERAVVLATINDDPETLEHLHQLVENKEIEIERGQEAILFACLNNYSQCIQVLYKMGYRVELQETDKEYLPDLIKKFDNDFSNMFEGIKHIEQWTKIKKGIRELCCVDLATKIGKQSEKKEDEENSTELIPRKKTSRSNSVFSAEEDPLTRLWSIKAYANHQYILTEFLNETEGKTNFREFDPMRKGVILARYCKFLSMIHVQYSREYLEISKVRRC